MNNATTTPANEILQQLGGNKFIAMTGSKNFFSDNSGYTLSMRLANNISKAQFLHITLNSMDLYEMVFNKVVKKSGLYINIEVARYECVYSDMLQPIFTKVTGLNTHL